MEGKISTSIITLSTDPNTRYTDKIGLNMIYKEEITDYINRIKKFNRNLCKSYIE